MYLYKVIMKNILEFLAKNPVFSRDEFIAFLDKRGTTVVNTQNAVLQYHIKQGHVVRIKQGLFATVLFGEKAVNYPVDPYLISGKATSDAVLSYHTALEYHGLAYTVFNNFTFCSNTRSRTFLFQGHLFEATSFPSILKKNKNEMFSTELLKRQGLDIRVTSLERTFVDVLDQPNRSGGWGEVCRSIDSITVMDLDIVVKYALLLEKATTIVKVGYFLEKMRKALGTTEYHLRLLERHLPKQPNYLNRHQLQGGTLIKRWNLIVPEKIINQQWEEPIYED